MTARVSKAKCLSKPPQALAKGAAKVPVQLTAKPYRTIVAVDGKVTVEETPESVAEFEQAFGSKSPDFQVHTLGQVLNVIRAGPDLTVPGNAALTMMAAINPTNELEAALAAQMVAAHHFAMLSWSRAATQTCVEVVQANASLANKASRTFTMQMEALAKMRRGGEQVVRHVHVNDGGQAIVAGTFNHGAGGRG